MEDEIQAAPSADNGNVPVEDTLNDNAPSESPDDSPKEGEETTPEPDTSVDDNLYELPDGRKLSGEDVKKEYMSLLSDYTQKSQKLAEFEKNTINNDKAPESKPYEDPNWTPSTWAELINIAKTELKQESELEMQQKLRQQQELENSVLSELEQLKKADPSLNENSLFVHANEYRQKYGVSFPNLSSAYQHMKDEQNKLKSVQQIAAKNKEKHNDPVSTPSNSNPIGNKPDPTMFGSAVDFLRSLK